MNLLIKTLSPVHIGSGAEISPLEYIVHKGSFHRIHMDSLFRDPDFKPYSGSFIRDAIGGTRSVRELVPVELTLHHILYRLPLSLSAETLFKEKPISIREQIKTAGRAFIPGSSLKGSLLSALLFHELVKRWNSDADKKRIRETIVSYRNPTKAFDDLLDFCFPGFTKAGGSGKFKHWLDISDTDTRPVEQTLQVFLGTTEGSSRPLKVAYEAIKPGVSFTCTIQPDPGFAYSPQNLLKFVDEFYKKVLQKDPAPLQIPEGAYLMRVGQGCGAYSTSLLLFAETVGLQEYRGARKPKTRKRADGKAMGWIALIPRSSRQ